MYLEWTKHLKDKEEIKKFSNQVLSAKPVLDHLVRIIEDKEKALDRSETSIQVYDTPSWSYRQAHKNGNRESLSFLKQLVNLDQQKENK